MPIATLHEIAPTVLPASLGATRVRAHRRQICRVDARLPRRRRAVARLRPSAPAEDPARRRCRSTSRSWRRSTAEARAQGRPLAGARSRDAPRAARRGVREGRRPRPAAAAGRPARRRRSDGVLFPEQRSERRLLQRADQPRGLPADRDHDAEAGAAAHERRQRRRLAEHAADHSAFCESRDDFVR